MELRRAISKFSGPVTRGPAIEGSQTGHAGADTDAELKELMRKIALECLGIHFVTGGANSSGCFSVALTMKSCETGRVTGEREREKKRARLKRRQVMGKKSGLGLTWNLSRSLKRKFNSPAAVSYFKRK